MSDVFFATSFIRSLTFHQCLLHDEIFCPALLRFYDASLPTSSHFNAPLAKHGKLCSHRDGAVLR